MLSTEVVQNIEDVLKTPELLEELEMARAVKLC